MYRGAEPTDTGFETPDIVSTILSPDDMLLLGVITALDPKALTEETMPDPDGVVLSVME